MTEVVVIEAEAETPPAVPAPVVVVADTDSGGDELAMTVGRLEAEVSELRERLAEATATAEDAENTADLALEVATEPPPKPVVIAEPEPEHHDEPDTPPNNKHKFFQSYDELRGS